MYHHVKYKVIIYFILDMFSSADWICHFVIIIITHNASRRFSLSQLELQSDILFVILF